jgi:hypothetical protein
MQFDIKAIGRAETMSNFRASGKLRDLRNSVDDLN